jgi:hypothetical protein
MKLNSLGRPKIRHKRTFFRQFRARKNAPTRAVLGWRVLEIAAAPGAPGVFSGHFRTFWDIFGRYGRSNPSGK